MNIELTYEEIKILCFAMKNLINRTTDVKNLLYTPQGVENITNMLQKYEEVYEKLEAAAEAEY